MRGGRPGDRYVKVVEPFATDFRRRAPGHLVASERVLAPDRRIRPSWRTCLRRVLIGRRIASEKELDGADRAVQGAGRLRLGQHLVVGLCHRGDHAGRWWRPAPGRWPLTMPLTFAIVAVLRSWSPATSRRSAPIRTAAAPTSSPATTWGVGPGLMAAAALLTDYVLTVAVSVAAGVAALTSIFPGLFDCRVRGRRRLHRPAVARQPARASARARTSSPSRPTSTWWRSIGLLGVSASGRCHRHAARRTRRHPDGAEAGRGSRRWACC